ncbi:MAG: AAA family ATPase [Actinomycetota bacterium]|nr:AAA family ATPase [Actinomycetota bacterium]MDK1016006.1 AAA family ATPase [Actinomycetota bacterium]MDK1026239.1 AAA family ATPase [Actinomycetota bacterium]MDK1037658.1 AAA family ATPase [Actinomycetota bacterium]MDK1095717.1 AAA family ATPase [Actinomycetota bacterium]
MLEEVVVSNLGLIPHASISPSQGLTVITGETGAGKTVMLGALRLLVGEPAAKGVIGPHGDEADVSALFVESEETTVRRVITRNRSKAYLDGAITTASALREAVGPKISIVGQHDRHTITSSPGVRKLLDQALSDTERAHLEEYAQAWSAYETIRAEAELLGTDHRHLERELETLRFQITEIEDAGFAPGDEDALRSRVERLRNAEALATYVDTVLADLGDQGGSAYLASGVRALGAAAALDRSLAALSDQVSDAAVTISELTAEIARYASTLDVDPRQLEATEQRVALLSSLQRKYGDGLDDIETFRKSAVARLDELTLLIKSAGDIEERLGRAVDAVAIQGDSLRSARRQAAKRLEATAVEHMLELGFSSPVIEISVLRSSPGPRGADTAKVLFASDDALQAAPISEIASGGELSRLVLALTLASGAADAQVVAFDEIDSGIGGTTALAMGRKLASLARDRQVICVTHLPQVAAFADRHYVVAREGTRTSIFRTEGDSRIEELARMLAGLSESEKGREHANELLALAAAARDE